MQLLVIINNTKNLFVLHAMELLQQYETNWSALKYEDSIKTWKKCKLDIFFPSISISRI